MKYYHRIEDLRIDSDLTQEQTAKIFNLHKTQYQRYENAEKNGFFEFIIQISKYYKVSIDYIAGLTNDKRGLTRSELSAEETEILKKIRSLSNERKYKLLGRLDTYCEEQQEEQALTKEAQ